MAVPVRQEKLSPPNFSEGSLSLSGCESDGGKGGRGDRCRPAHAPRPRQPQFPARPAGQSHCLQGPWWPAGDAPQQEPALHGPGGGGRDPTQTGGGGSGPAPESTRRTTPGGRSYGSSDTRTPSEGSVNARAQRRVPARHFTGDRKPHRGGNNRGTPTCTAARGRSLAGAELSWGALRRGGWEAPHMGWGLNTGNRAGSRRPPPELGDQGQVCRTLSHTRQNRRPSEQ